jgi:acyl-CoA synthetase (AMP-forming)/AMP-acid ligase II
MDVRGLMRRSAQQWGEYEAVVAGEDRLTYAEAWERGLRLANVFGEMGLRPGDRVAVLEDNSLEAVDFFLACTAANLVRVPLYARGSVESHAHMVDHTGARLLVVSERYAPEVKGLKDQLPALEQVLVRDATYPQLLEGASAEDPDPVISPDDLYLIRHTAGTTGRSKGIGITHNRFLASERDWFYGFPPVEIGDACLHASPISHGSGYFFVPPWAAAGRNILLQDFNPEDVLDIMERERVGFMFLVPTMLATLARHESAAGRDWSALKAIAIAGSPTSETTLWKAREVFGDVVYQIYGQSEVFPATIISPKELYADIPGSQPIRSAGRAFPFAELQILNIETHMPLPIGEEGEIAARTDGQMESFWGDPEATAKKIRDGWVLTGDVGKLDEHGYLYVLDRVDDMIISGGFNIWPAELENVIAAHPAVTEVAVFGIPDDRWGETPAAVCVVAQPDGLDEAEIVELCRTRLGSYKKPSTVVITSDPLPKSPAGKVLRRALREPYWEGRDRRIAGS